jgi:hypothetical protein
VSDRTFTLIDLGISIGSAVLIAIDDDADDNSPWLFAIPGVFFASTVIGVVSTERCLDKSRPKNLGNGYQRSGPVLYRSGTPAEPPAPEQGEDAEALPPIPDRPVNPLRLPEDYEPTSTGDPDDDSASPDQHLVPCDLVNHLSCPPRHICVIIDGYQGLCKPAEDDAAPAAE